MGLSICRWLETYAASLGLVPSSGQASTPPSIALHATPAIPPQVAQQAHDPTHYPTPHQTHHQAHHRINHRINHRANHQATEQATLLRGIAARIAQEMALSQGSIFDVAVLAELLELPFDRARTLLQPLALVTSQLLRQLSRRRPLRRNEGAWLSFQIAYLRALDELLRQEAELHRPWLDAAEIPLAPGALSRPLESASMAISAPTNPVLAGLIETLRPQKLTETQAEQALVSGSQSLLVRQIRQAVVAWLTFNGAEEREAELLIQRLEHGLAGHLLATIAENATPLAQLQKFVRLGNLSTWSNPEEDEQDYEVLEDSSAEGTIEPQRELYRAQLLQSLSDPLLGQSFGLRDLYMPSLGEERSLAAQLTPAQAAETQEIHDALSWAITQLGVPSEISLLEAGAGQGKTCFCHQLAVRLAQDLYPTWMPIVIALRGLRLGATLEETLAPALPNGLFTERESWLSAQNPPCVLILDGLDELPLGPDSEGQISQFLAQLEAFQRRYRRENGQPRHRILVTSQPATFDALLKAHPELKLEQRYRRLRLMPMDKSALKTWFRHWATLQNKAIAQSYFNFLKKGGAFRTSSATAVGELAHWPFTLLLMALLHRDGFLDERIFGLSAESLQFEIYERLNTWLLGAATDAYPQPGMLADRSRSGPAHACRSPDAVANLLAGRSPRAVRHHIQNVALRVLQSGLGQLPLTPTEAAVLSDPDLGPLPSFYFLHRNLQSDAGSSSEQAQTYLTFSSPTLGDYSCAEAIAASLQTVSQRIQTRYGETFVLETSKAVAEHLYQILGHSLLSPRLVSFILERLRREQQRESPGVSFLALSDRLYQFYRDYCQGRWLDEGVAQTAHQTFRTLQNPFSMLQVDAAVGLNVFGLLCAFARETERPFWPCGRPQSAEYNPNRLLQLLGRTAILSPLAFWIHARHQLGQLQLDQARLTQVMLAGADLRGIQCRGASLMGSNLEGADLRRAELSGSNLQRVNLRHSDLRQTDLQGTDLRYADLTGANLDGANLSNACVAQAHMDATTSAMAQKAGAFFSVTEYQFYQQLVQAEVEVEIESEGEIRPENEIGTQTAGDTDETLQRPLATAEYSPVFSSHSSPPLARGSANPLLANDLDEIPLENPEAETAIYALYPAEETSEGARPVTGITTLEDTEVLAESGANTRDTHRANAKPGDSYEARAIAREVVPEDETIAI